MILLCFWSFHTTLLRALSSTLLCDNTCYHTHCVRVDLLNICVHIVHQQRFKERLMGTSGFPDYILNSSVPHQLSGGRINPLQPNLHQPAAAAASCSRTCSPATAKCSLRWAGRGWSRHSGKNIIAYSNALQLMGCIACINLLQPNLQPLCVLGGAGGGGDRVPFEPQILLMGQLCSDCWCMLFISSW